MNQMMLLKKREPCTCSSVDGTIIEAANIQQQTMVITALEMSEGYRENGKIIARSNYEVARSILSLSNNLLVSLGMLTDEIERKNKLDEYYFLKREITLLEDKLMEWGVFQEAYEKMKLVEIPRIVVQDEEVNFIAIAFNKEGIEAIKEYCKNELKPPNEFIKNCIYSGKENFEIVFTCNCFGDEKGEDEVKIMIPELYMKIPTGCMEVTSIQNKSEKWYPFFNHFRDGTLTCTVNGKPHKGYATDGFATANIFYRTYEKAKKEKRNISTSFSVYGISLKDIEHMVEVLREISQNEHTIAEKQKIAELKNFFRSLNREVDLFNLRSLHQQLEEQVRDYKIKRYMMENKK